MAHPDDEVLGCGGTLAKHAENGETVWIRLASTRSASLEMHSRQAADFLGAQWSQVGEFPDQQFDVAPLLEIIEWIEALKEQDPDVIYTHHPQDINLDHALTARAVLTAFRPKPATKPRTILACEVLSSTEYSYPRTFSPNWYVSLTDAQVGKAQAALRCYESELQLYPHPRSIQALRNRAAMRGSEIGVAYAECFELLRHGPA